MGIEEYNCPECGSSNTHFSALSSGWKCQSCKNEFEIKKKGGEKKMTTGDGEKKAGRAPALVPTEIGGEKLGYTIVAIKDDKYMLSTPKGRFGVYTDPWKSSEVCLLRPVKELSDAQHFLEHGELPKKEAPEKKEPKVKAEGKKTEEKKE